MTYKIYLDKAREAADAAEAVILKYFGKGVDVQLKGDLSPVTQADIETEETIRAILSEAFPEHGFFGEETGKSQEDAEFLWLVDPIDGTKSFVRDTPFFSTQIALMHKGELVVGVSNAPAYRQQAWAARGTGAFLNGEAIQCSTVADWPQVSLSVGNLKTLAGDEAGWRRYGDLVTQVNRLRGYGDFCHYHMLAAGQCELVLESDVNILDIAALSVIVREAGGVFTDLSGAPLDLDTTTVLAAGSAPLHAAALAHMQG
ncbi:inositol monophosphatase family protein [Granulosicoccaceae sp. 1_MG-2023]|nr:inositol monophosphatase family protein [Granulosicoccaceae sp. 1_MG-2023]